MNGETRTNNLWVVAAHICAFLVGAYFLYAAFGKVVQPRQFAIDIGNYKVFPESLLNLGAIFMPWIEIGAAVALIVPMTRRAGAIMIAAMLVVFIVIIYYAAIHLGLDIDCGCTGKGSSAAGWLTIGRNILLLAGTAVAFFTPRWQRQAETRPAFEVVTDGRTG